MQKPETNSPTVWAFLWAVKSHWFTLVSGGAIMVLLTLLERFSGKNVPTWVYVGVLILFGFRACYLAWRDAQEKRGTVSDTGRQKRKMIADRLTQLIKESPPVTPAGLAVQGPFEGLAEIARIRAHRTQVMNFLEVHCGPEAVARFEKRGTRGLEEMLAEALQDEDPTRPVIKGGIDEVIVEKTMPEVQIVGFDYHMTIRFWLRSETVATNFRRFELVLFTENAKHSEYKGEKQVLDGTLCLDRKQYQKIGGESEPATVFTKLVDFDAAAPLEQWLTREGWLRFTIRNVDYGEARGAGLKFLRLELRVTDGSGNLWTLTTEPPWESAGPKLEIKRCPSRENWVQLGSRARFQSPK